VGFDTFTYSGSRDRRREADMGMMYDELSISGRLCNEKCRASLHCLAVSYSTSKGARLLPR